MSTYVGIDGLDEQKQYFESFPELSAKAAALAINRVAQSSGLALARSEIMDEIAFPKDYLKGDRLRAGSQPATPENLIASIIARKRATSLARFATSGAVSQFGKQTGVTVQVSKGKSTYLKRAFLVKLNKGASFDEDNYNVGLAIRLKPGEKLTNVKGTHLGYLDKAKQVAILYGPSVDQVFRDVANKIEPGILDMLATEFLRQFARLA